MIRNLIIICFILFPISFVFGQSGHSSNLKNTDPRFSVFGSPQPSLWEFQIASWSLNDEFGYAFNLYSKNQRNKTFFLRLMNGVYDNQNQNKSSQLAGGLSLFPINNDDRFQIDVGGIFDLLENSSLTNKSLYSRITFRPKKTMWFRFGYELADDQITRYNSPDQKITNNAAYFSGRFDTGKLSWLGLIGTGKINEKFNTRYGAAGIIKGPFNTFFLGGQIISNERMENTRTLAIGRWAPFRSDGLPSGIFIWKHRDKFDFQLGGIFWGVTNSFVRPAALGMAQGIFISSVALTDNSSLRQKQLMTITDDYNNADISLFYVYMKKGIEMIPGNINYIGFRSIQLFKLFRKIKFSFFSKPVIGIFYNELTEPEFNPVSRSFKDIESNSWSYQIGVTLFNKFVINVIHDPEKSKFIVGFSILYR